MCGIVGYVGKRCALPVLIKGLKRLEYRGYDSAGIAYVKEDHIHIEKSVGKIKELEKRIHFSDLSFVGIGHTRWATHGEVNILNSHPHQVGDITLVHNGILENYLELKEKLEDVGYSFKSTTDSEIACGYIDYLYQKSHNILDTLTDCTKVFQGSYAIVIMVADYPNQLFVMKKDSPLVIGIGENEYYVASDLLAYRDVVSQYIILEDLQVGEISENQIKIWKEKSKITLKIHQIDSQTEECDEENYESYMLKEMKEQPKLILKWNQMYLENINQLPDIRLYSNIQIVGCGTAYHAGLIGKYLMQEYTDFEISVYVASEYRYQKIFIDQNTLVIFVSQSGETADTLACIKRVQKYGAHTLGIVNVKDSSIARIVNQVIYTEAGQEIAVASTKAYLAQCYIFSLLALRLGIDLGKISYEKMLEEYLKLPRIIESMMDDSYYMITKRIKNAKDIFYLGRGIDYITMLEGSLKLKEISYLHSEAIPAGELKHGTISLIEKDTPVVGLLSKENIAGKTISNIKEVKARGAYVILLTTKEILEKLDKDCYDEVIILQKCPALLQPLINIIPLQFIAYSVAKAMGRDIDRPRNLAKSVTVE